MAGSAYAQSSLPACQGSDVSKWTSCFGAYTYTYTDGSKYVGEFKDYKVNRKGIEYAPRGSIIREGHL
jgi:hypothetical protein